MTDEELEQRLFADAATDAADEPGTAPPFDRVLAGAVGRRSPARWIAAAAAVVLVAGVATTIAVARSDDGSSPDAAGGTSLPGLPAARGKEVLQHLTSAGFDGVRLVAGNARALDVVVPYSRDPGACSTFDPTVTVVAQNATAVRLRVAGYSYLPRAKKGEQYVGFSCYGGDSRTVRVTLDAPLGTRRIYDDTDTTPVVPVDVGGPPTPSYLPAGYVADPAGGSDTERSYVDGPDTITVSLGGAPPAGTGEQGVGQIAGRPVGLTDSAHDRCLDWDPVGGQHRSVCWDGDSVPLSVAELLRVARSLP